MHFFMDSGNEVTADEEGDDYVGTFPSLSIAYTYIYLQHAEIRSLQHRNEINKKSRGHERKMMKQIKSSKKVCDCIDLNGISYSAIVAVISEKYYKVELLSIASIA